MSRYKLYVLKDSKKEAITSISNVNNLEEAVNFFASLKGLPKKHFLQIYNVSEHE
jgi:hypothetical protein